MGNYSSSDHMDLFGGLPERGDCAPDPDAIRDVYRAAEGEDGHCDLCGAPVGKHHLSYCELRGDV